MITHSETVWNVEEVDLGFGKWLRMSNEEFRVSSWEVIKNGEETFFATGDQSGAQRVLHSDVEEYVYACAESVGASSKTRWRSLQREEEVISRGWYR